MLDRLRASGRMLMNKRTKQQTNTTDYNTSWRVFYDKYCIIVERIRRAWQSQTWGRPAPQVRVQNQFQEDEIPLAVMAGRMKKFNENTSIIP